MAQGSRYQQKKHSNTRTQFCKSPATTGIQFGYKWNGYSGNIWSQIVQAEKYDEI